MAGEFKIKNGAIVSGSITGITESGADNSNKMASTSWVRTHVANSGGLTGTHYMFVKGNGTPAQNGTELVAAYNAAKTKVNVTFFPGPNLGNDNFYVFPGNNTFQVYTPFNYPLGPTTANVTGDGFTGTISIDIISYNGFILEFINNENFSIFDITYFAINIPSIKRSTVLIAPGYYDLPNYLIIDTQYVDLVSLDGNLSVYTNLYPINVYANNVLIKGIYNPFFEINNNLNNLTLENCKGGDSSFNAIGGSGGVISSTFINCDGGADSFGFYATLSGTFINCVGGNGSFGKYGNISGIFDNCTGGNNSFGYNAQISGTFTNCVAGDNSFGGYGFISPQGTFNNCVGGSNSFANDGIFMNCVGGNGSFGGANTDIYGKLYYCRLTSGTFSIVSSGGRTYYCVDGNGNVNNQ